MEKILIATKNKGKLNDIREIFKDLNVEIISLLDLNSKLEIAETGVTFEENAQIKAKVCFQHFNLPSIGDDSGLVVDQLNGAPGIFSARYAGDNSDDQQNNKKLISELEKFPEPHRAKFVCIASYYDGNRFINSYGEVNGRIVLNARGLNGFGYDPLFIPNGFDKTFGEFTLEEKNKISHRSIAFKKLYKKLISVL